jgi:hypothetical protein
MGRRARRTRVERQHTGMFCSIISLCTLPAKENKFLEFSVHVFYVNFTVKLCKVAQISFGRGNFAIGFTKDI